MPWTTPRTPVTNRAPAPAWRCTQLLARRHELRQLALAASQTVWQTRMRCTALRHAKAKRF